MNPEISVIISAFNEELSIRRAIESILNQTFQNFEIIIINDCSNDKTLEIIKSYESNKIILHNNIINKGLVESLNIGISLSKGKYIARMDADDISNPNRLKVQYKFLEKNSEYSGCGSNAEIILINENNRSSITNFPTSFSQVKHQIIKDNCFIHGTIMLRTDIIKKYGGYRNINGLEDYDLWVRILKKRKIINLPDILLIKYENDNWLTRPLYKNFNKVIFFLNKMRIQINACRYTSDYILFCPYFIKTFLLAFREMLYLIKVLKK